MNTNFNDAVASQLAALSISNFKINKIVLIKTGTYNDMHYRPYAIDTGVEYLFRLGNAIHNDVNHNSTPIHSIGAANQLAGMVRPSDIPGSIIAIQNSWKEARYRFFLEVEVNTLGSTFIYYYQGFSEHADDVISGKIDTELKFFINSVVIVSKLTSNTGIVTNNVIYNTNILRTHIDDYNAHYNRTNALVRVMRPTDIFTGGSSEFTLNETLSDQYSLPADGVVVDSRQIVTDTPKASQRKNAIASSYTSNIVNSYIESRNLTDIGDSAFDIYNTASNITAEYTLETDPMLRILGLAHTYNSFIENSFTIGILSNIDPTVHSRVNRILSKNVANVNNAATIDSANINGTHSVGSTEYWNTVSTETTVAQMLASALPALMADSLISKVAFTAVTGTSETGNIFVPINCQTIISNTDITMFMDKFKLRFMREVFLDISYNNMVYVNLMVNADLFNETWIKITIGDGATVTYATPTYCDGLFSPVLSDSDASYKNTIHAFNTVFETVDHS